MLRIFPLLGAVLALSMFGATSLALAGGHGRDDGGDQQSGHHRSGESGSGNQGGSGNRWKDDDQQGEDQQGDSRSGDRGSGCGSQQSGGQQQDTGQQQGGQQQDTGQQQGGQQQGGQQYKRRYCECAKYARSSRRGHSARHRSRSAGYRARCSSALDRHYLKAAIEGDRFEIAGGQLAQQKGTSQKIKDLGARLVADHTESLNEAVKLAQRIGIDVPDQPNAEQRWDLKVVATFSGNTFDRRYAELEVGDHLVDIDEASEEAEQGCNSAVRTSAAKEIPTLQQHLALAQDALASVGGAL